MRAKKQYGKSDMDTAHSTNGKEPEQKKNQTNAHPRVANVKAPYVYTELILTISRKQSTGFQ
jgi:hypothetical protein